jgi:hypothetical protein
MRGFEQAGLPAAVLPENDVVLTQGRKPGITQVTEIEDRQLLQQDANPPAVTGAPPERGTGLATTPG